MRASVGPDPHLQALLARAGAAGAGAAYSPAPAYIRRILAACAPPAEAALHVQLAQAQAADGASHLHATQHGTLPGTLIEPLTTRELEDPCTIGERLSDKEIARALSLATGTVHRHTANIYAKLGVSRRWDAVAKAQALGLLPR